ncbi:spalt-like transcription factor 3 S homeolog isoform X2 [Xenopus laevis]|uniref:Spalt-like transcription factor 3 S homeolog isoform X2 n=1 Tax=Xenopus laevis TaxID=8355 RepID=A0A8J0VJ24_XENLA|nr:spalt-like transcription factor 3 S homeolog isoform X2 [Xenopus laevis]
MSRRKQAKPQHLKSEEGITTEGNPNNAAAEGPDDCDSGNESRSGSEETNVCEKCCAEFFKWTDFLDHKKTCTKNPLVLIVNDDLAAPVTEEVPEPSPAGSPSNHAESETAEENIQVENNDTCDIKDTEKEEEPMEVEITEEKNYPSQEASDSSTLLPQIPEPSSITNYNMPNTNVTLETLQSTTVAVAQFSQNARCVGGANAATAMAIPMILEQLMALQQQQIHQLQLIEQIRSQVALMNRQPLRPPLNPTVPSQNVPIPASNQLQGFAAHSTLQLTSVVPPTLSGPANSGQLPLFENPQHMSQPPSGASTPNIPCPVSSAPTESTTSLSANSKATSAAHCSLSNSTSNPTHPQSSSTPPSLGHGNILNSSSSLPSPLLPQSSSNSVIFPNPLVSIAATANALDPLSALMKHRKGKPPNVSVFETKTTSEDPFFKHKCRFCAKVFGSDSALQIHLRSHTGERPFKCNICGNRFSTKGNLKVHFQRHKEKYPHIQMNPYPVPEYLDNVPTSSGIPYGMTFPPEKPVTTWLDSKPVLSTIPTTIGLQLPPTIPGVNNYNDSPSITPSNQSPQRPSPASSECNSLSPNINNSEPCIQASSESSQPEQTRTITPKQEPIVQPSSSTRVGEQPVNVQISSPVTTPVPTVTDSSVSTSHSNSVLPPMSDQFKAKFPFGGLLESMQTSETSKLQQLVENIDKKMTDPNQCVICHRVLSCHSALKMHYRTHTGERPFKCKVCGRAFTTKGNLKTHFGVHRAKPPLRVQHSCPICQKKFTNAVVLQQHIRMHMGGQIPNTPLPEGFQDAMDSELSYDEKNLETMSDYDDDFDDNSLEDDLDLKDTPSDSSKPLIPYSGASPASPPNVISSIAALENQMKMIDSVMTAQQFIGLKNIENGSGEIDHLSNDSYFAVGDLESQSAGSPAMSESSSSMQVLSPAHSHSESIRSKSPVISSQEEPPVIQLKTEKPDSPIPTPENDGVLDLTSTNPGRPIIKEEAPYSLLFLSRERGPSQTTTSLVTSTAPVMIKMEVNGHTKPISLGEGPHLPVGIQVPAAPQTAMSPGITPMLALPPRRTPKQHNCHSCGKTFSSASALQIHERIHTGEKPFGCTICGRAFTTKGNLKVHMGTHMWNNAPARRGRRLSVENPMALLGGDALKFSEMFQKDLAARAMNVDSGFWNQYAAAITNGLAMKNNEISVIQNGGIPQLPVSLGGSAIPTLGNISSGMDRTRTGSSPPIINLDKVGSESIVNRPFTRFIEENKEIGIN